MDPARHKVLWDGKDVTLTVTEFLILEALAQRPGVVKIAQPIARHRLSGRRLCRRPHDRQPHQAHPPQVPRRRPRVRCDRDPLWRRIPIRRRMSEARPRPELVGTVDAGAPHPRGEHADARAGRARDPLPRQLPQPAGEGARPTRSRPRPAMAATALAAVPPSPARKRCSPIVAGQNGSRIRLYGAGRRAAARQLAADRPDLSPARSDHPEMDQGRRPRARPRLQRDRRRAKAPTISSSRPVDRLPGLARSVERHAGPARPQTEIRQAPDLTPVFSAAAPVGRRIDPAGHRQRPRLHPDRAQAAPARC